MNERPDRGLTIREALGLREVALVLLGNQAPDARQRLALETASAPGWQLFLGAECCAGLMASALRQAAWLDRLPAPARGAVLDSERRELQRVLSARAQLREIDAAAASRGITVLVLKGGAMVAGGESVDLGDLDLAAGAEDCRSLVSALAERGYGVLPGGMLDELTPAGAHGNTHPTATAVAGGAPLPWASTYGSHATTLEMAGTLPIELHVAAEVPCPTDRSPGYRSLVRQRGAATVHDLLLHAVVQHPFRRGHLRDLLVLADAISRCDAAEVRAVRHLCLHHPYAIELLAMLGQAWALAERTPIVDPEATRRTVARKYALALKKPARLARFMPRWRGRLAYVALERPALRRLELAALVRDTGREHRAYALASLAVRAPRLARLTSSLMATGYRIFVASLVIASGPFIRHRVSRLVRASERAMARTDGPTVAAHALMRREPSMPASS